jgi:hypothetical protein
MEEVEAGEEEKEQREHATLYMPIVLRYPSVFYRAPTASALTRQRQTFVR